MPGRCEDKRNRRRGEGHQDGFKKKLPHQASGSYTQYFSYAYFFCSFQGAGGGQVHKIDTGDQHDEHGNAGKQNHIEPASGWSRLPDRCRMQVGIGHFFKRNRIALVIRIMFFYKSGSSVPAMH